MASKFNSQFIKKVEKELSKKVTDKMDKIALEIHKELVFATPVDLGQARAGWNFTLNVSDPTYPTRPPKGTILQAPVTKLPVPSATKAGDSYHISNSVKHIVYLNEGTSEQASVNFIESVVANTIERVK